MRTDGVLLQDILDAIDEVRKVEPELARRSAGPGARIRDADAGLD